MLIAHLPAGYLLTKGLQNKFKNKKYLWLGLLGSVFPDLDMFYFHFIDKKQTLHHAFAFHLPAFWAGILLIFVLINLFLRKKELWQMTTIFFGGIFLHLILDSIIEHGIKWLYPLSDKYFYFVTIPAKFDWWVWSFIFHWSFLLEISIVGLAVFVYFKSKTKKS